MASNPWDYYERLGDRRGDKPADVISSAVADVRAQRAKQTIMQAPESPVDAARVTRVAREAGEPPAIVADRVGDYEKSLGAQRLADVAARYSIVSDWFDKNPRSLVAAQGDARSVGFLGRTLEFFSEIPDALQAGTTRTAKSLSELYQSIDEAILPFTNPSGGRQQLDQYEANRASYQRRYDVQRPRSDSFVVQSALSGIESIPGSAASIAVGAVTRSPGAAATVMGITTGAPAYREALDAGKSTGTALRYGVEQGLIEGLTEKVPAGRWLDAITKRTPAGKAILSSLAAEIPGEQLATILQDFSTWATLTPDRPFSEYLAERPQAALQTAIATITGTAAQVGATQVAVKTGDALVSRAQSARRARAEREVLTGFEKAAADSAMRANDPDGYAEMVGKMAEQSGVSGVMVDAAAVREYMQSDSYDPYSDPLEAYRDQVDEAYEVGGDVVLPSDFALGTLPGTPAWSALKDDMRLTAGGITPREAQTFEEAMADVVAEVEAAQQEEFDSLQAQIDAQGKLLKSVQEKLMNAGFTPYAAQQNATLIVQRIATRAARMGQELTGGEFTTEVRQVLPPELAAARDADATDLVINALRKGRDPASQSGPSLLEWISARGGVNDTGGDLKSMGLDQWHRGKPGKRKLLRKFDPTAALGGVSGAGDYGIDNTLRAAIEAGFFPELVGVENEAGASTLDTQALLDAMSAELAGVKRYAADARVDGYRAAAQELDDLLRQRGLDPDGMSDAELRAVIAQLDQAGEGGRTLFQGGVDAYERRTPEEAGETTGLTLANSLAKAARLARDNRFPTGRDLKLALQQIALDAQKAEGVDLSGFDDETANRLADYVVEDALEAVQDNQNAIGWYDRAVTAAKQELAKLYPEIATDPQAEFAFIWALAVTSNGLKVDKNFELAAKAYEAWKSEGAFPTNIGIGQAAKGINDGLALYAKLIENLGSWEAAREFMISEHPVRDIEKMAGIPISGEGKGEMVRGAAILGPKIGNGFFSNLYGFFDSLTMDRWLMRTVGRWRGTLIDINEKMVSQKREEIKAHLASLSPADLKYLAGFYNGSDIKFTGKLSVATVDAIANETAKRSMDPGWRERINKAVGGEDMRKLGNGLAKYLDGQVEQPAGTKERAFIRKVFQQGLDRLKEKDGLESLTMADLQALLWYPEKLLYESAKKPAGEEVRGYEDDEAPDYANAARKLVRDRLGQAVRDGDGRRADRAGSGSQQGAEAADAQVGVREYYQSAEGDRALNDGPRGRIRFEQVPVIELFQGRNLSTLLHELGHQYLEELRFDATGLTAPEQLIKDWETTQAWFKANGYEVVDGFIPTEAHELWARGFERYLMEGKAPSSALARVFETFRGWLMSIYRKVEALRSPITPEIREVFDRLLATDEELQQQREAHALMPLFKDAAAIGMTGPEFQAYQDQFNEARVDAQSEVLAKAMREVKARVTKEYRDQRAVVEADVTESVDQRPLFRALRNLKTMPVRKGWLEDNMGLDVFDLMPKRVPPLWSDKGAHPDAVAEMSGYGSGRQMIEALIGAEMAHRQAVEGGDKRTLRERTIQSEVDAIMRERYGDPLTDGTIEREALAAVNNEKQGEVLASELRILSRKTGQRPTPYRIARQWARGKVRQGVYATEASPSAIQRHARAVSKHGSEAEKAMLAGKFDEAFAAKQKQMLSSALLAEAKAANDEVTAAQKRMDKIARRQTSKSVDQDYLDQAHALLEQVDLRPRSQKSIDRQGKWAEWAAAREAEGFDVVVPASFEATLGKTNWTRLPVETMLALDETVQQIMHLGRLKQSLLDGKERREWEEIYKEAEASAGGLKGNPPRDLMEPGFWDAIKSGAASIDGALLKMETVFDWLDGGNSNGVFNRIAFRPVADAQGREQDMLVDYYGRIKALFEAVPGEVASRWQDKVSPPFINRETGLPERMKRHQLIAAALNVGNAGNLQRLTDGYGWNAQALLDYLNSELTAEEWQFVQGVWDTIDTLWPEIEAMERRVNGVAPEKVEATEIVTPFGTLRGGYYPAIYDTTRSYRQEENRAAGENTLFEPNAVRATTRSGSTKARAEQVTAPILLDLGVINRHLGEVIHDITHREAVMQAWKFLTSERVMRAVDQALGPEIRKQFKPWVKFVANSWAMERAGNEGFGKFLTKLRANATVVGMGLRATTMMTQIAGYSNSQEAIGGTWLAEAIARSTASPVESFDFVMANSDEVRHRMDTLDRDIRNELAAMTATNPATKMGRTLLEGRKFFFHGIGYMDRVVVVPTWLAAYNKATAEGMNHDDARYAADKAVRVSQGSGAPKDMAAIQRGTGRYGEALKLMTMFYTYLSAYYQRQRSLYRDATGEDVRRPRDFPKLASRAFWLIVLPPILTEILRAAAGADAGPDDDEWWAQWYLRKLLVNSVGPIPLVRDVFEPAWNKARGGDWFQTSISPIQRGLESIVNTAGDIGNIVRGEETKKATKNALETIGYTTGMIPGQIASAAQFLVDVAEGDADPETWSDWMEGLSTGKLEED